MTLTAARSDWRTRAACRGLDPDLFHPVKDGTSTAVHTAAAKNVCRTCFVRWSCLHDHLIHHPANGQEDLGIWGGTTPRDRRNIRNDPGRLAIVHAGAQLEQQTDAA